VLLEEIPDLSNLNAIGSKIIKNDLKIAEHFKSIMSLNSNSISILKTYGNFLVKVLNDKSGGL